MLFASIYNTIQSLPHLPTFFSYRDVLDILVVAFLVYLVLIFIKRTRSFFIFNSILLLLLINYVSKSFDLSLTRQLFQPLLTFFLIIFVVVFQKEIRRFFDWFSISSRNLSFLRTLSASSEVSSIIVRALTVMAENKVGAIIVLPGEYPLEGLIEGGFPLDGKVSLPLILSIFDHHSPGHDGAILIQDNVIKKFGLHLPLAEDYKGYAKYGTRHRAAVGITEHSDALAIVVSEERGTISLAESGQLRGVEDLEALEEKIKTFLKENIVETKNKGFLQHFIIKDFWTKVLSVMIAVTLWFFFVFQAGVVTQDFNIPVEVRYLPAQYMVQDVSPQEITVSFAGRNTDIDSLDPHKLHAVLNLSSVHEGKQSISVDTSDIQYPSYLDLIKVNPRSVSITVTQVKNKQ